MWKATWDISHHKVSTIWIFHVVMPKMSKSHIICFAKNVENLATFAEGFWPEFQPRGRFMKYSMSVIWSLGHWPVHIFEDWPFYLFLVAVSESDKGLVLSQLLLYLNSSPACLVLFAFEHLFTNIILSDWEYQCLLWNYSFDFQYFVNICISLDISNICKMGKYGDCCNKLIISEYSQMVGTIWQYQQESIKKIFSCWYHQLIGTWTLTVCLINRILNSNWFEFLNWSKSYKLRAFFTLINVTYFQNYLTKIDFLNEFCKFRF